MHQISDGAQKATCRLGPHGDVLVPRPALPCTLTPHVRRLRSTVCGVRRHTERRPITNANLRIAKLLCMAGG
jgi:hypothetical protein